MRVTLNWMIENFYHLNQDYFDGALPMPKLCVDASEWRFGQCSMKGGEWKFGKWVKRPIYRISMSNNWDRPEGDSLNTLLHEMIHLYFYSQNRTDIGHGKEFMQMGRSFDKYGFNIQKRSSLRSAIRPVFLGKHKRVLPVAEDERTLSFSTCALTALLLFVAWAMLSNPSVPSIVWLLVKTYA